MAAFSFVAIWALLAGAVGAAFVAVAPGFPLIPALVLAAGQWALLRPRVSWATRWGAGAAASAGLVAVVAPFLAPVLFASLPRSSVGLAYTAVTSLLGAVSLVIALAPPLGGRCLAWLVTRPVSAALAWAAVSQLFPLVAFSGSRLLFTCATAICVAAVDAAVLVWVSRGAVLDRASTAAGEAAPVDDELAALRRELEAADAPSSPPAASIGGARGIGVEVPVSIILVIAVIGGFIAFALGKEVTVDPSLVLAVAAPYVVSALCMVTPPLRQAGLGLAAGGGLIVALAAAPLLLFLTLFVIASGSQSESAIAIVMFGLMPLHGALAFTAFHALKGSAPGGHRGAVVVLGAVGAVVYGLAVTAFVEQQDAREQREQARVYEAEHVPDRLFEDLRSCVSQRIQASPDADWPESVEELGPAGLNCLALERLQPADRSYEIRWAVPRGARRPAFTACVTDVSSSGHMSAIALDERLSLNKRESPGGDPDRACAAAYGYSNVSYDALRALRYCLWRFAAEHSSYPPSLDDVDACVPLDEPSNRSRRYTYAPGPSEADGRVTGFVLIEGWTTFEHGRRTRRMDETGAIRVTYETRLPLESDPLEREASAKVLPSPDWRDLQAYDHLRGSAAAALAIRACLADTFVACAPAARLMAETRQSTAEQQANLLERGCNQGNAASCFGLARLSIEGRLASMPPARGEQLRLIACSTAPVPAGCDDAEGSLKAAATTETTAAPTYEMAGGRRPE